MAEPIVWMTTVPAAPTSIRHEPRDWPTAIPGAAVRAVASTHVNVVPLGVFALPVCVTAQFVGFVAAAIASAYGVGETDAMTGVWSVDGSDGTVIGSGEKNWHARLASPASSR